MPIDKKKLREQMLEAWSDEPRKYTPESIQEAKEYLASLPPIPDHSKYRLTWELMNTPYDI